MTPEELKALPSVAASPQSNLAVDSISPLFVTRKRRLREIQRQDYPVRRAKPGSQNPLEPGRS